MKLKVRYGLTLVWFSLGCVFYNLYSPTGSNLDTFLRSYDKEGRHDVEGDYVVSSAVTYISAVPERHNKDTGGSKSVVQPTSEIMLGQNYSEWKPDPQRLAVLLQHLNLSLMEAASHLPLTLQGPDNLENRTLCHTTDGAPVDIIFLVHTATYNADKRQRMRTSFLNRSYSGELHVRSLFLLGEATNQSVQRALEAEHAKYGDLLQGRFIDSYFNITHKAVMGLRWLREHCEKVKVVVKVDDDVLVDIFKLRMRYWPLMVNRSRSIWCSVLNKAPVHRGGKWAISKSLFQKVGYYPYPFCMGLAAIFTGDVIPLLYNAARFVPTFWVDDVYVYGMLRYLSKDVCLYNVGWSINVIVHAFGNAAACAKKDDCPMLIAVTESEQGYQQLWNLTLRRGLSNESDGLVKSVSLDVHSGDNTIWSTPFLNCS